MPALSAAALTLLRRRVSGEGVPVDAGTLEAYRELARAGLMYPVSGFVSGPEATFRFTREGWDRREEWCRAEAPMHRP